MFDNQAQGQQYIASLKAQLSPMESRLSELESMPSIVRSRKPHLKAEYDSLIGPIKQLKEKIKMARNRFEEMMAMDEAQGSSARLGDSLSKNLKLAVIGSGALLVILVVGAIVYKKMKK